MSTTQTVHHPMFARLWVAMSSHETELITRLRRENLDGLTGRVLEIGAGAGTNFAYYPDTVEQVVAIEPEEHLFEHAQRAAAAAPVPVSVTEKTGEELANDPAGEEPFDAVVCSLLWGAAFGLPGLLGHRAVNTLDAMVGHRSARYARFGTASARCDDVLGLVPARATGALACLLAPLVGGSSGRAWRVMWRDHAAHPSPNGGWPESAWAGSLGVRLGGVNDYAGRVEERPTLGDGGLPTAHDVRRAARLVPLVSWTSAVLAVSISIIRGATWGNSALKLRRG